MNTCDDVCVGVTCKGTWCGGDLVGETCDDPIELGDGGSIDVDLCDYQQNYEYGWCGMNGPELVFTLDANYEQGQLVMSTVGSFPGMYVNYRFWTYDKCVSSEGYEVNGFCYLDQAAGIGWGGYDPEWKLYFAVGGIEGACGQVKISASTKSTK